MSSPAVCVSFQFSAMLAPFPFFISVPGFPVSVPFEESLNYPTIVKSSKLDRVVDRGKPWFMVHGLAHGS